MSLHRLAALSAAAVVLSIAPLAHAQDDDVGTMRLGAYLALGLGGEIDVDTDLAGTSVDADADATVGFGLRAEVPVHEYIAVGGLFELLTFEADGFSGSERESVFDIDVWVKGRYRFELSPGLILEPYLGVPFGLTLAVLADPSDARSDAVWPGFNIGVLAGVAILFQERFGGFLELGWRHHQAFNELDTVFGDVELAVKTNQFALHLGFMVAF